MDFQSKVCLNKSDLIIYSKNKVVVLYNQKLGKHIILSKEVYNFFKNADSERISINEFIDCFQNREDKKYIKQVIANMIKSGIILHKNYNKEIEEQFLINSAYLCLTNRCNLKCKHCCSSCSDKENDYLSTKDIKNIIDTLKELNISNIVLTGGEPLLRYDFEEIVIYAKKQIPKVNLILSTNSILINDKNIDFIINNFNKIDISIDGVDEETCSQTRGKGVFGKVLDSVDKLKRKGFVNISLSMVFGQKNDYLKDDFIKLNESIETNPVMRYFVPTGRGLENKDQYLYDDTILPITIPEMLVDRNKKSKRISSCACNALKSQIFINYDGNIYPCPSLVKDIYNAGSIFDSDIINVLKNKNTNSLGTYKNIEKIYPYNFEKCKDCDVNIFCWHCPAILDSVKDNDVEFNKWCNLMKSNLNRIIWDEEGE